jgi:Holliday junction resolvase
MANYARGADRERKALRLYRSMGYAVTRSAGSHGEADLWAAKPGELLLVQVKADAAGPFAHFGPLARESLLEEARLAGGVPILLWWPPRRPPQVLTADSWPS